MLKELNDKLGKFHTTPFLFVGSGISRRYLNLDSWEGLLRHFAAETKNSEFGYEYYLNEAKSQNCPEGILPRVAKLIEYDFNARWYLDEKYQHQREKWRGEIQNKNISPFKIAITEYLQNAMDFQEQYSKEMELLKAVGKKSISGIITTNYDNLLEKLMPDYKVYVGQEELLFSPLQGIGELYKIHGTLASPSSIVINEDDYVNFDNKNAYLASKLLTIFLEHPIIFMGYSIEDKNVQNILRAIIDCLPQEKLLQLSDRLFFLVWSEEPTDIEISKYSKSFSDGKALDMVQIKAHDFIPVYESLLQIKNKYPAQILRKLKNDVYELVKSSDPSERIKVVDFEDSHNLENIEVVMGIGILNKLGVKGYDGIQAIDLFEDIILNNKNFDCEMVAEYSLEKLYKQTGGSLPIYKYLQNSKQSLDKFLKEPITSPQYFLNRTLRDIRKKFSDKGSSVSVIVNKYKTKRVFAQLALMDFNTNQVSDLHDFLSKFLVENPEALTKAPYKTDLKRLIKILDWIKFGNKHA